MLLLIEHDQLTQILVVDQIRQSTFSEFHLTDLPTNLTFFATNRSDQGHDLRQLIAGSCNVILQLGLLIDDLFRNRKVAVNGVAGLVGVVLGDNIRNDDTHQHVVF